MLLLGACATLAGVEDGELATDAGLDAGSGGSSAVGGTGAAGGVSAGGAAGSASGGSAGTTAGGSSGGGSAGSSTGGAAGSTSSGGAGGSGAAGSKYAALVLADGPIAYWRLGETSGINAVDLTGNGHDGLLKNGVKLGEPGALTGDSDAAMYFDGTTYVDIGDELDLAGSATFTIEAWVYPQAGKGGYFGKAMYDSGYKGYFFADNDSTLQFVRDGATVAVPVITFTAYTHIVGTYDGLNLIVYLNGSKAGAKVATNSVTDHPNPLMIGAVNGWGDFVGWIDEVAIYDKALSESEIKAHYDAGKGL